jgi:hypothetical protein
MAAGCIFIALMLKHGEIEEMEFCCLELIADQIDTLFGLELLQVMLRCLA